MSHHDSLQRPRRLRENPNLRRLVRETRLSAEDFIAPLFLKQGLGLKKEIKSMPGVFQLSPDLALKACESLLEQDVGSVLLFGIPEHKDAEASEAYDPKSVVPMSIEMIKKEFPELNVMADVCLCEYTDHGHCGLIKEREGKKVISNDSSLEVLSRIAGTYARAGADVIAPSDMMDGRVAVIRDELDAAGFKHIPIMSYAVKYASQFYGPFRDALESAPEFGDRKSYQMDPGNSREALKEAWLDIDEGADILMVKPALSYLDIISKVKAETDRPLAAYQVSGEYSMIKLAAREGLADENALALETLLSIKRAGADLIISYFSSKIQEILKLQ